MPLFMPLFNGILVISEKLAPETSLSYSSFVMVFASNIVVFTFKSWCKDTNNFLNYKEINRILEGITRFLCK